MSELTGSQRERFWDACHRVVAYGLTRYSSGNLSWRFDDDLVAITEKGSWLGELDENQIVVCRLADGEVLNERTPSIETRFHLGILRARPEVRVVLHYQSPCATAICCAEPADYNYNILPEMPVYIGPVGVVEYLTPGSPELAAAVVEAMRTHNLALLRNHGQVAVGKDFNDAIQKAGFFELVCEILLSGVRARPLTATELDRLRAYAVGKAKPQGENEGRAR